MLQVPEGFRNIGDEEEDYTVPEPALPEPESMKALRGTSFDSNPVTSWLQQKGPLEPERTPFQKFQRRTKEAFDTGVDALFSPFSAAVDYTRRNTELLNRQNRAEDRPSIAALRGFAGGVGEAAANMATPFNIATAALPARGIMAGVQGLGSGFQAGMAIPELQEDLEQGDYEGAALEAGMAGMALLGAEPMFRGRRPSMRVLQGEVLPPEAPPLRRRLYGPTIDVDVVQPQLKAGARFYQGGEGTTDLWNAGQPTPDQAIFEARGDTVAGRPLVERPGIYDSNRPLDVDEFTRALTEGQRPSPRLAEIEDLLLSQEGATMEPAQPAFPGVLEAGGLRRPGMESLSRVGYDEAIPAPPGPEVLPPARGDVGGPKRRELSEGEQRGIAELERFLDAKYGPDRPTVGNGLYREPETGVQPSGNLPERPIAAPSRMEPRRVGEGSTQRRGLSTKDRELVARQVQKQALAGYTGDLDALGERLLAKREAFVNRTKTTPELARQDLFDSLVQDAIKRGYTGDPKELYGLLDERAQVLKEIDAEVESSGGNPETLLREVAKLGGITRRRGGETGEISTLREFDDIAKRFGRGVFNDATGITADDAAMQLNQDPRFKHIDGPDALLEEIKNAGIALREGRGGKLAITPERMGIRPGSTWWDELARKLGDEPVAPFDDITSPNFDPQIAAGGTGNYGNILQPREGSLPNEFNPAIPEPTQAFNVETGKLEPITPPRAEPTIELLDEAGGVVNASGESAASAEALSRQRGMSSRGEKFVVYDRAGNKRPLIGPDAVDYTPRQGETYGVEGSEGFRALDDRGGRPPRGGVDELADILDTGEMQPRLPEAGRVRDAEVTTPEFDVPYALTAESASRPAVQPGMLDLEKLIGDVDKELPSNVRSFLEKQLKYTPEQVSAMDVDEAMRVGRERIPNPEPAAPTTAPAQATVKPLPERTQLPSMRTFEETRQARGQQRRGRLEQTRVEPGARPMETPAKIQRTAQEAVGTPSAAPPDRAAGLSPRERGESPRQVSQRAQHMKSWLDDPTPENFAKWVKETMGQAERVNEKQLRAGTAKEGQLPKFDKETGEYLAGGIFPGAQLLANPKAMKAAAKILLGSPAARAAMGAGIGYFGNDDPLQGAAIGALIGAGLSKNLARETTKFLQQMVSRTAGGLNDARGVKPVMRPSNLARDINPLEQSFGSPMRTVPEQFMKAQKELDALDRLFQGRDEFGKKLFNETIPQTAAERSVARKVYIGDVLTDLQKDARAFHSAGQHRRAEYIEKLVDVLKEKPPAINRFVKRVGGDISEKALNQLTRHMYRLQLGANIGVGLVNRTQKYYALRRVPYNYLSNAQKYVKSPAGKAATDFLKLEHPTDAPEGVSAKTWEKVNAADKLLQSPLRSGDIQNRRVVYAAAKKYAQDKGGVETSAGKFDATEDAVHQWAMDVVAETQTLPGAMGQNPFMRDVGAFSAYTKYPTMWAELMLDSLRNPDQRSVKLLMLMAGATGLSTAIGVSGIDLMIPRLIPGLGVGRAVVDAARHVAGPSIGAPADHSIKDDIPGMSIPGYVRKVASEAQEFGRVGTGPHRHLTPSGNVQEHSGLEALENLLGMTSTRQAAERRTINREMQERNEREIEQRERSREKRREQFERGGGETLRERLRKSTPRKERRAFDERFEGVR